jgi:undecaprenyl phosphate-alpha-L-ara4FN deformylase
VGPYGVREARLLDTATPGGASDPRPARIIGLRVDVDTHEGTRDGVPRLLEIFRSAGVSASLYFSMGPDRSGRAVFNVFRRGFLAKMRRTGAGRVYGWRTILSGTLLPARPIGTAFPDILRRARDEGHETGVHAWDHRTWQDRLLRFPEDRVARELDRGYQAFLSATGERPETFAAPAWLTRDEALVHQEEYRLAYATDCRGVEPFLPVVAGRALRTPQVPATLPTLDEALGDTHATPADYFRAMLDEAGGLSWPVFTLHAELEGGPYAQEFSEFLRAAAERGFTCAPLGRLLAERLRRGPLAVGRLGYGPVRGRHGLLSVQVAA